MLKSYPTPRHWDVKASFFWSRGTYVGALVTTEGPAIVVASFGSALAVPCTARTLPILRALVFPHIARFEERIDEFRSQQRKHERDVTYDEVFSSVHDGTPSALGPWELNTDQWSELDWLVKNVYASAMWCLDDCQRIEGVEASPIAYNFGNGPMHDYWF